MAGSEACGVRGIGPRWEWDHVSIMLCRKLWVQVVLWILCNTLKRSCVTATLCETVSPSSRDSCGFQSMVGSQGAKSATTQNLLKTNLLGAGEMVQRGCS